jgi:hypothetical protein
VDGVGEFYDKRTGETFVPRGANYGFVPLGNGFTNLVLKVGIYDPERTREDFSRLAHLEYNTVRVFLDHCNQGAGCIGDSDNVGLNPEYLDNIADMMLAGRETGIFILFTSNDLPDQGGYSEEANIGSGGTFAGYRNSYYLRPRAVTATRRYWRDLLTGLIERNAAFDAVLGWQLLNEQWMFRDQPPLSLTEGLVETTTGSYDMSDPEQKTQMVSDGIVYYIAQMKEEILLHDPTALVTMGFFVPEIAAPDWYVETASLFERSDLDFFDFHAYPGGPSLRDHVEHFGMFGYDLKPILLGEYGAFRHIYPEIDSAARVITNWVAESCIYGFDGWLYWTYYPSDASAGDRTWGLVDEDDFMLDLFAPLNQPIPACRWMFPAIIWHTGNRSWLRAAFRVNLPKTLWTIMRARSGAPARDPSNGFKLICREPIVLRRCVCWWRNIPQGIRSTAYRYAPPAAMPIKPFMSSMIPRMIITGWCSFRMCHWRKSSRSASRR